MKELIEGGIRVPNWQDKSEIETRHTACVMANAVQKEVIALRKKYFKKKRK